MLNRIQLQFPEVVLHLSTLATEEQLMKMALLPTASEFVAVELSSATMSSTGRDKAIDSHFQILVGGDV
jgi:hypothetical protein